MIDGFNDNDNRTKQNQNEEQFQINLDRVIDKNQIKLMKEKFEKSELRRQLRSMLQQQNMLNDLKFLKRVDSESQESIMAQLIQVKDNYSPSKQFKQVHSKEELQQQQKDAKDFTNQLRIEKEIRLLKLEEFKAKEREQLKNKIEIEKQKEQEKIDQRIYERKLFLEQKGQERIQRASYRQANNIQVSFSPDQNLPSKSVSPMRSNQYLYKRMEENFHKTLILPQQQQYNQILEERRKRMRDVSVSISNLKKHSLEYQKHMWELSEKKIKNKKEKKKVNLLSKGYKDTDQLRYQNDKNQSLISKDLLLDNQRISDQQATQSKGDNYLYRNKYHEIILREQFERSQEKIKEQEKKKLVILQKQIYDKMVKEVYKPKKSERLEEMTKENKLRFSKNRLEFSVLKNKEEQNNSGVNGFSPYKDYLKELKELRKTRNQNTSISSNDKVSSKTELQDIRSLKIHQESQNSPDFEQVYQDQNSPKIKKSQTPNLKLQNSNLKQMRIQRSLNFDCTPYKQSSTPQLGVNKSHDYLAQLRKEREDKQNKIISSKHILDSMKFHDENNILNQKNSKSPILPQSLAYQKDRKIDLIKSEIKQSLKDKSPEKYYIALDKMHAYEDQVKRREKYVNLQNQMRGNTKIQIEDDESINQMYLQAIDAKLTILNHL